MAYPTGSVQVTGPIGTTNSTDTYGTHYDFLGQGGHMTIDTVANRNLITTERRRFGMTVTVYSDPTPANNKIYLLANTALGGTNNTITDNANWIALSSIIGGGHIIQSNGTPLTQRTVLNILNGLTAVDDAINSKTTLSVGGTLIADIILDGNSNAHAISFVDLDEFEVVTVNNIELTSSQQLRLTGNDVILNTGTDAISITDTEVELFRPLQLQTVSSLPSAVSAQLLYNSTTLDFYAGSGSNWTAITRSEIVDTSASFITLNESHRNKIIRCTSSSLQTITAGTLSAGYTVTIVKASTGDVFIQSTGTLDAIDDTISVQNGAATLVCRGTNNWMAFGALGASGGVVLNDGSGTTANGNSIDLGGLVTGDINVDFDSIHQFTFANINAITFSTSSNSLLSISSIGGNDLIQVDAPITMPPFTTGTLPSVSTYERAIVYDETVNALKYSDGTTWITLGSSTLTDGSGTTANGTAVDLGGTRTSSVEITGIDNFFRVFADEFGVGQSFLGIEPTGAGMSYTLNDNSVLSAVGVDVEGVNLTNRLNLDAGTTTIAPLLFDSSSSSLLTTPLNGAMEFDGTHLYFTIGSTRYQIDQQAGLADGDKGNITVSGGGAVWTIDNDVVTFAKIQNSAAAGLSVIGRSTNSAGDFAEINAANDFEVLRRSGTSIGFGTVSTNGIANQAVTRSKISNGLELSVIGRSANSIGVTADIQATANSNAVFRESGSTIGWGSINLASSGAVGSSILPVANGGTGLASVTANYILYGNGTSALGSEAGFEYNASTNTFTAPFINAGSTSTNGGITIYGENYAGTNSTTTQLTLRKGTTGTPAAGIGSTISMMIEDSVAINVASNWTVYLEDVTNATRDTMVDISGKRNGQDISVIAGSGDNDRLDTSFSTFRVGAGSSVGTSRSILAEGTGSNIDLVISAKGDGDVTINAGSTADGIMFLKAEAVGYTSTTYGGGRIALIPRTGGYIAAGTASGLWTKTLAAGQASLGIYTERAVDTGASVASTHKWRITINGTEYNVLLEAV